MPMRLNGQYQQDLSSCLSGDLEVQCDSGSFRAACSRFSTGVGLLPVLSTDGDPLGLTVNSFTSVSLDPPMVLMCIDYRSRILGHFAQGSRFAVNILGEGQRHLSQRFAKGSADQFSDVEYVRGRFGVPILSGTIACFECTLSQSIPAGDHMILVGTVDKVSHADGNGLVYFGSRYRV